MYASRGRHRAELSVSTDFCGFSLRTFFSYIHTPPTHTHTHTHTHARTHAQTGTHAQHRDRGEYIDKLFFGEACLALHLVECVGLHMGQKTEHRRCLYVEYKRLH